MDGAHLPPTPHLDRTSVLRRAATPHLPALVAAGGERAGLRFLEFFPAAIRNPRTRRACVPAPAQDRGMERILLALLLKTDRRGSDDIERAVEAAARLGFDITGQGRASISIRASPEVFEYLFGTHLQESCRQSLPEPAMLVGRRATPRRVPCRRVTCPPQRHPSGGRAVAPRYPSLASSKDGVGKTLVSMILTSRLAAKVFRVVAIDADPNGALADWRLTVWEGSSFGGSRAGCSSARVPQPGKRDNDQDCTPRG